jgi:hypothetical protein
MSSALRFLNEAEIFMPPLARMPVPRQNSFIAADLVFRHC